MPDRGRRVLHRVCDSVVGANWRPTRFADELLLSRYACMVCHVIPSTTVLLPCAHTLCEQCLAGCVVQGGGRSCPLDREPFCEDECQKNQIPAKKKENIKAHCWNEGDGCQFVGTVEAVLLHYDRECAFHAIQCHHCEQKILRSEIAAHYVAGCCENVSYAHGALSNGQGPSLAICDASALREELSTIQSLMNEVLESCRTSNSAPSQDLICAVKGFESSCLREMKNIEANICATVARQLNVRREELGELKRDACCDQLSAFQSQINKLVEQSRAHDASHLKEMVRVLRDSESKLKENMKTQLEKIVPVLKEPGCDLKGRVDRVEANITSSLNYTQKVLQASIDSLQRHIGPSERGVSSTASSGDTDSSSWRKEGRLILRKLKSLVDASVKRETLIGEDSLLSLDSLRQRVSRDAEKPSVSEVCEVHHIPCVRGPSKDILYSVCVTLENAEAIFQLKSKYPVRLDEFQFRDMHTRLVFSAQVREQPVIEARVHCVKISSNCSFEFSTLELLALGTKGVGNLAFQKVRETECTACCKRGIPHRLAVFEVRKDKFFADGFVEDGKLVLALRFAKEGP